MGDGVLDSNIPLRDAFYLLFGMASFAGVLYAIFSGKTKSVGDERERIVRIDENLKEMRSDVADIKAELRQTKSMMSDHERRLIKLEEDLSTMWKRIDEIKEKIC